MTRHNQVWITIIALGWIAVAVSASLTNGFRERPTWLPAWSHNVAGEVGK